MAFALSLAFALVGITLLIAASLIARFIVRVVDQYDRKSKSSKLRKVSNLVDFAVYSNVYIKLTGDKLRVYLTYIMSTGGAILFVGSALMAINGLNFVR
jgi:hypothetical protein